MKPAFFRIAAVMVLILAFVLTWAAGHRGMMPLDQSMPIDGAWRLLQGQTLYRDFISPFGPMVFLIQAGFFALVGVSWTGAVVAAATVNVLATASVMRTTWLLCGDGRARYSLLTGLVTACLFQAPFGTLWFEQTAFAFDLFAVQALLESQGRRDGTAWALVGLAGASAALACLSKQDAGAMFLPVLVLALFVSGPMRRAHAVSRSLALAVGFTVVWGVFVAWLLLVSDWTTWWRHFVLIPSSLGRQRWHELHFTLVWYVKHLIVLLPAAVTLMARTVSRKPTARSWDPLRPAAFGLSLLLYRDVFGMTNAQDSSNTWSLSAVGILLTLGALEGLTGSRRLDGPPAGFARVWRPGLATAGALVAIAFAAAGVRISLDRRVQEFAPGSAFVGRVRVPGLERLKWADVHPRDQTLRAGDLEAVARLLQARQQNFFVLGECTFLYAFLGRPSPQPMLHFQEGHSYRREDIPRLDAQIVEALAHNDVRIIVREKSGFIIHGVEQFPQTWHWLTANFPRRQELGFFEIWERAADAPTRPGVQRSLAPRSSASTPSVDRNGVWTIPSGPAERTHTVPSDLSAAIFTR